MSTKRNSFKTPVCIPFFLKQKAGGEGWVESCTLLENANHRLSGVFVETQRHIPDAP